MYLFKKTNNVTVQSSSEPPQTQTSNKQQRRRPSPFLRQRIHKTNIEPNTPKIICQGDKFHGPIDSLDDMFHGPIARQLSQGSLMFLDSGK